MSKKLYVGNLSYNTTNADLENLFNEFGTIQSVQVIIDRDTGRSKGFGFVEMENDNEAQMAIDALSGKEYGGREITVNVARPKEDRGGLHGHAGGRRNYGGGHR